MAWRTVPNFFPDYDSLSAEDQYHLNEGYCISGYETKLSGKMYKKIRMEKNMDSSFGSLLSFLGFWNWHERWYIHKGWFFNSWRKRK